MERNSVGSNWKLSAEQHMHVFEYKRRFGTPDKIRTCDLLLRRQTAITCYQGLRLRKWTLNGQNLGVFQPEQEVNLNRVPPTNGLDGDPATLL